MIFLAHPFVDERHRLTHDDLRNPAVELRNMNYVILFLELLHDLVNAVEHRQGIHRFAQQPEKLVPGIGFFNQSQDVLKAF